MARYTQPRKTWSYSVDFKVKAVQLSQQPGLQVQQVAAGLDIHPFMLSRWRKEYRDGKLKGDGRRSVKVDKQKQTPSAKELTKIARLGRENARLKEENSLLKKWQRYLAEVHQTDLDSSKDTGHTE